MHRKAPFNGGEWTAGWTDRRPTFRREVSVNATVLRMRRDHGRHWRGCGRFYSSIRRSCGTDWIIE